MQVCIVAFFTKNAYNHTFFCELKKNTSTKSTMIMDTHCKSDTKTKAEL